MKIDYRGFFQKSALLGALTYLMLTGIAILLRQLPSFDLGQLGLILLAACPVVALGYGSASKLMGIQFLACFITGGVVFAAFLIGQYNESAMVYIPAYLSLVVLGYWLAGILGMKTKT
jgi:hypothetical protein